MTGVKETIQFVVALLVATAIVWGITYIADLQEKAQLAQNRGQVLGATSGIVKDAGKIDHQRVQLDIDVSGAAEDFQRSIREAMKNEPITRDRADRPVPVSVRNAARERRLARERSRRNAGEGEAVRPAPETPER